MKTSISECLASEGIVASCDTLGEVGLVATEIQGASDYITTAAVTAVGTTGVRITLTPNWTGATGMSLRGLPYDLSELSGSRCCVRSIFA